MTELAEKRVLLVGVGSAGAAGAVARRGAYFTGLFYLLYLMCTLFHRMVAMADAEEVDLALAVCGDPGEAGRDIRELLKPLRRASLIEVEDVAGEKHSSHFSSWSGQRQRGSRRIENGWDGCIKTLENESKLVISAGRAWGC